MKNCDGEAARTSFNISIMEIIYMLISVSLVLVGVIAWALLWAVRSGQFDDLEGPAHRILMEEDEYAKVHPKHSSTVTEDRDER